MSYVSLLTTVHTILSFIAIGLGIVATNGLFRGNHSTRWTKSFYFTAVAVTFTGFIFPFNGVTPAFAVGIVATVVLLVWLIAYRSHLAGAWRSVYALGIVASLYLLIFVAIAQAFSKIPVLHGLAPTGSEPPFAIGEIVGLVVFIVIGVGAARRFKPTS